MDYNENNYPEGSEAGIQKNQKKVGEGKNNFWRGVLAGILASIFIASCAYTAIKIYTIVQLKEETNALRSEDESPKEVVSDGTMAKLRTIEDVITQFYYLDEIEKQDLIDGMYSGMVEALGDPYSTYYSVEQLQRIMEQTEGIYFGIGAYIGLDPQTQLPTISGVIKETPAEEAKLRSGDILYKINDESTQGLELTEVVSRIKGLEGTTVHLTIYRAGEPDYLEIDVERRQIISPTVNSEMLDGNMGYVQITEFDNVTYDQYMEAMAVLRAQGMKGLILDLRSNPGGNLSTVVEIARQMLPAGLIVYTEDKAGERVEYTSDGSKQLEIPLVVLIDQNSASASEILAGAVKDYGIGELVGMQSYGKGIVQRIITLTDDTAVKLTVSTYFTPKGNNIHGIGIEPDEICEFDSERYYDDGYDNQLERAKEVMAEKIAALGSK